MVNITKGSHVNFGNYWQNDDKTKTPIKWIVLDVKGNEALLLSDYVLDAHVFYHEFVLKSWKDSDIRKWLNTEFLETAFSDKEKEMIVFSDLKNINFRQEVSDKIFCLDFFELQSFFDGCDFSGMKINQALQCKPTNYAVTRGVFVNDYNGFSFWWTRETSMMYQPHAFVVNAGGSCCEYTIHSNDGGVRPALRVRL